ncbi:hypothetical protein [Frigoriglobus tundricola]|uniref:Uncharacterized protein n=1 Tax=Frigoriglobus tundricola TaxID=2774151 RepID=A0A6M5YJE9_9BACT|nr:hypothetical protein [Frigoriglobus tundricola]QJW94187.1 hypothetical protein FTUN_1706 [Frigoriglobus tundricola]
MVQFNPADPLLRLTFIVCCVVFTIAFFVEVGSYLVWCVRVIEKIRERRHQRVLELLDRQLAADKLKWAAREDIPLPPIPEPPHERKT